MNYGTSARLFDNPFEKFVFTFGMNLQQTIYLNSAI